MGIFQPEQCYSLEMIRNIISPFLLSQEQMQDPTTIKYMSHSKEFIRAIAGNPVINRHLDVPLPLRKVFESNLLSSSTSLAEKIFESSVFDSLREDIVKKLSKSVSGTSLTDQETILQSSDLYHDLLTQYAYRGMIREANFWYTAALRGATKSQLEYSRLTLLLSSVYVHRLSLMRDGKVAPSSKDDLFSISEKAEKLSKLAEQIKPKRLADGEVLDSITK